MAQYSLPIQEVQMVCEHPPQIIDLQCADHRPTNRAVPAAVVQSYRVGATNTDSDKQMGLSQEETRSSTNRRRITGRTGGNDPGPMTIWRGSPRCQDAVSQCFHPSSQSGSGCSPCPGRMRPEIARLTGLFRIGSNSVERLECTTLDGHTTQA